MSAAGDEFGAARRRSRSGRGTGMRERGAVTTEVVIAVPVLMLTVLLGIQFFLYLQASHIAYAAAQEGVRVARAEKASAGKGTATALNYARQIGGGFLLGPSASVQGGADTVTVTVRGRIQHVLPLEVVGIKLSVERQHSGSRERFTTPGRVR